MAFHSFQVYLFTQSIYSVLVPSPTSGKVIWVAQLQSTVHPWSTQTWHQSQITPYKHDCWGPPQKVSVGGSSQKNGPWAKMAPQTKTYSNHQPSSRHLCCHTWGPALDHGWAPWAHSPSTKLLFKAHSYLSACSGIWGTSTCWHFIKA